MNQPSLPASPTGSQLRARFVSGLIKLGQVSLLTRETVRQAFRRPLELSALMEQIEGIGVRSMSVVVLTGIFSSSGMSSLRASIA